MLGRFGRSSSEIFTTGPTITNDQFGRIARDRVEQLGVEPLVDHAVEAEARPRQIFLVGRLELPRARLAEMRAVDRRGEAVDVRMAVLLRLEQARSAGEDDVRPVDQLLLQLEQLGRRELELCSSSIASKTVTVGVDVREKGSIIGV